MKRFLLLAVFLLSMIMNVGSMNEIRGVSDKQVIQEISNVGYHDSGDRGRYIPFNYSTFEQEQGPNGIIIIQTIHYECMSGGAQDCHKFEIVIKEEIP